MRCHDETMTTVVRMLRNSIRTVGKLRDKTCQLMDIIPIRKVVPPDDVVIVSGIRTCIENRLHMRESLHPRKS